MRKSNLFLLCLLAMSLAFGFQSCDKDDSPATNTEDASGNNGGSNNNDPVPPTFTFSENLNAENRTIESGAELKLTIGNLSAESVVLAYLDGEAIEVKDGVIVLPTTTAGEHKVKVVVDNEEEEFSFKVLLPALEIKTCALSSEGTELELNSKLKLNLETNNPCTITVKVNGNAIEAKDGDYVLPTDKIGKYAVSVEFNDGQNETQTKNLDYKVFDVLSFSVNGISFKMIRVAGYDGGDFYIGQTEVTQALWAEIMKNTDMEKPSSYYVGGNYPAHSVSWYDIRDEENGFLKKLNEATGKNFRLPSSAEWEYAAKGGDPDAVYSGCNEEENLEDFAWYIKNSGVYDFREVATKKANGYGLYDMSGNVWEWCEDAIDSFRVTRGGSCSNFSALCNVSFVNRTPPNEWYHIGFRLALSL